MKDLQILTEVGPDGILQLNVPLGKDEAKSAVVVTISPLKSDSAMQAGNSDWKAFVDETYGSCEGLELREPDDLPLPPVAE